LPLRIRTDGRFSSNLLVDDVICEMFHVAFYYEISYISLFTYRIQFAILTDQESYREKEKKGREKEKERERKREREK